MSEISAFSVYKQLSKKKKTKKSKLRGVIKKKSKLPLINQERRRPISQPTTISIEELSNCSNFYEKPENIFRTIISPMQPKTFFEKNWENSPIVIKRSSKDYYRYILTTKKLDEIIRNNSLFYTRNIDVVSYVNGKKETHNPEGRAIPAVLWDYYENGCSIRVLNPHTYSTKLHSLLSSLQEYFGCMVGVNAYLTPPNSQGFAPHYDDIEAFVLQLEGRKHWKLYTPLNKHEVLPRFSSKNFDRSELGEPLKTVTLEAGDFLYFPRGTIHEGFTDAHSHSFHITLSVYQKTAYVDLMEHILKPALQKASNEDVNFRRGLPLHYLQHLGSINSGSTSSVRTQVEGTVKNLFARLFEYIDIDAAVDQLGKTFMWDSMPPLPLSSEKSHMVHENSDTLILGRAVNTVEIHLDIKVRLFRYHCIRVVNDDTEVGTARIYYNTENAKYYHGEEQQFMTVDLELIPAIENLIYNYPEFIEVKSLPLHDDQHKMQIVSDLWERGLLVTEEPLTTNA